MSPGFFFINGTTNPSPQLANPKLTSTPPSPKNNRRNGFSRRQKLSTTELQLTITNCAAVFSKTFSKYVNVLRDRHIDESVFAQLSHLINNGSVRYVGQGVFPMRGLLAPHNAAMASADIWRGGGFSMRKLGMGKRLGRSDSRVIYI